MLKTRSERIGPESEFLNSFLESNDFFDYHKYNSLVLKEIYAEVGIPDALIISWKKDQKIHWNKGRKELTKKDLKILHHISTFLSKGITVDKIVDQLGYSHREISKSLQKLEESKLIEKHANKIRVKNLKENFFLKEIVAIEAKLDKRKEAIKQADINRNFSSHSYILMPQKKRGRNGDNLDRSDVGFISYDGQKARLVKVARKNKLPNSYFSWVINEYVGRLLSQEENAGS